MSSTVRRKLTTILAADAFGYSRAMEVDEMGTLAALRAARAVFSQSIARHEGRIANTAGDGLIAEFPSVVEAVSCAIEVQRELVTGDGAPGGSLRFRIGVHLGDVIVEGGDLLGEGVNLAARLQSMAEPGGILVSQQVYDQVHNKLGVTFRYLGERRPKNYEDDIPVYRIERDGPQGSRRVFPTIERVPRIFDGAGAAAAPDLARRVRHLAKVFAAVWLVLLVVDLATGTTFWSHWPGLVLAALLALKAAPLVARGGLTVPLVGGLVVVAVLVLINLFTWSGHPWAIYAIAALALVVALRRLGSRS
ncbi:MAG: adenylate/guanylate cyclase domain-containing protein [Rhodospirillaceae bacterium]|nr:adenylate/guanylate cyclase domain-containing protein [Rhodospirillaceae bacterium]